MNEAFYIQIPFLRKAIKVECQSTEICDLLKKVYKHYLVEKNFIKKDVLILSIVINEDKYVISMGEKRNIAGNTEYCINCISELIAHNDYFDYDNYWFLHGAFMVKGKEAIILIGGTGNGKSTLAMGMYKNGYLYGSDDLIFVDKKSGSFQGFLRPIQIRDFDLIKKFGWYESQKNEMLIENIRKDPLNRTTIFPYYVADKAVDIIDIYLLHRSEEQDFIRVASNVRIEELLYNTYHVRQISDNIKLVAFLMRNTKVEKIEYSNGEQVIQYIMSKEKSKNDNKCTGCIY